MIKEIRFYFSSSGSYSHFIEDSDEDLVVLLATVDFVDGQYIIKKDEFNEVTTIIQLSNVLMAVLIPRPDIVRKSEQKIEQETKSAA